MLAILERHLQALRGARSDADILNVLAEAAHAFGFRSAYLVEYAGKLAQAQHILDTDPSRRAWWDDYFGSDLRPSSRHVAAMLDGGPVLRFDAGRFGPGSEKLRAACERYDMVDVVSIPISHEEDIVGIASFCGRPKLDKQQEMALQLLGYTTFAQTRSFRKAHGGRSEMTLTPREKEVIKLSSEGLTSQEIAERLGMSPRTANQHIDNVADKLGTRNRAHTVAEAIRHNLLD
jgi:LuxR family quorum sensing-dependent transcriptional regulator